MERRKKWIMSGVLSFILVLGLLVITSCEEIENNWDDQYGIITITNNSSSTVNSIKILRYSDESGAKIVDNNPLQSGSSRTYLNKDVLKLEWEGFYGNVIKRRYVRILSYSKQVNLSSGQNVELVLTDSGLTISNPIYEQ